MTVDYIRLPVSILHIKDLSFVQKIILGLVTSFNSKGLRLSNSQLGQILGICAGQVSAAVADMERKNYIKIQNGRSKYRTIYLEENLQVENALLKGKPVSKSGLLQGFPVITSRKTCNITKETKEHIYDQINEPVSDHRPHTGSNGELFDRFWSVYPRKVGKKKCRDIWKRLKVSPELADQIVGKVKSYKTTKDWQKDGGRFIPHPSTWLNAGRWEDEIPEASTLKPGDIGYEQSEAEVTEMMKASGLL